MEEFAAVLFLKRHVSKNIKEAKEKEIESRKNGLQQQKKNSNNNSWRVEEKENGDGKNAGGGLKFWSLTRFVGDDVAFCYKMDQWSFLAFVIAFIIYNIVFFATYT